MRAETVEVSKGTLILGGRKVDSYEYRGLRLEEVATIWQAEAGLDRSRTDHTGFSLDPAFDSERLRALIIELAKQAGVEQAEENLPHSEFLLTARWSELVSGIAAEDPGAGRAFSELGSRRAMYQRARYLGELAGTEVGMILFYTDLLAKLWTINFALSAPTGQVPGFIDLDQVAAGLSTIYEREAEALPNARLWFEPSTQGYQAGPEGTVLYFSPVVARLFAMGNNAVEREKEVQTAAFFSQALDWWNDHYHEVARHEPEYFRLNEIMKWSLISAWLVENSEKASLAFLHSVGIDREHWFPEWADHNRDSLKFKAWEQLVFHERGWLGNTTESMEFPRSRVAGGVSLAKRERLRIESLRSRPHLAPSFRPHAVQKLIQEVDAKRLELPEGWIASFPKSAPGSVGLTPKPGMRLRGTDADLANQNQVRSYRRSGSTTKVGMEAAGQALGDLQIRKTARGFAAGWHGRDLDMGQSVAIRASRASDLEAAFTSDPTVATCLRLDGKERFAVKLHESETWMLVEPDPGSSTVSTGWLSRVASPGNGKSLRLNWVEETQVAKEIGADRFRKLVGRDSESNGILASLRNGDRQEAARRLRSNPVIWMKAANDNLVADLNHVKSLMADRKSNEALRFLSRMEQTYGEQPEIQLWTALARLDGPQPVGLDKAGIYLGSGRLRKPASLLEEIDARMAAARNPGDRQALDTVKRATEWAAHVPKAQELGRVHLGQSGLGNLTLTFETARPFKLGRKILETDASVGENVLLYLPDSLHLNKEDFSLPIASVIHNVQAGDFAHVFLLDAPALARLQPDQIVDAAQTTIVEGMQMNSLRLFRSVPRCSSGDSESGCSIYVALEPAQAA